MEVGHKRVEVLSQSPPGIRSSLPTGATRRIVETLGRRIANGVYPADAVIPKEDQLAQSLGVSRTTVRDAIKVLSGKSLLRTARRYGTRVQPVDEWNLLDPDVLAWHDPAHPRFRVIFAEAMELRRMIEPEAAALAARRASEAQRADILAAAEDMAQAQAAAESDDPAADHLLLAADCRFHTAVIEATGNLMMRQLSPTILSMVRIAHERGNGRMRFDRAPGDPHHATAKAIGDGDAAAARRWMAAVLYPDFNSLAP